MILERTENPDWLSNAYLLADGPGGRGVIVDGNGVLDPLVERAERDEIRVTHLLLTHRHGDHVAGVEEAAARLGAEIVGHPDLRDGDVVRTGDLEMRVLETPGHAPGHLAFSAASGDCFTGDLIFRRTVGGTRGGGPTGFEDLRESIMEKVLALPPETRLHPGHRLPTTAAEEWAENPFVRVWRGLDREDAEPCRVAGEDATLVVWAGDYDGGNKAWVRIDGRDAIVGGSQVERG